MLPWRVVEAINELKIVWIYTNEKQSEGEREREVLYQNDMLNPNIFLVFLPFLLFFFIEIINFSYLILLLLLLRNKKLNIKQ